MLGRDNLEWKKQLFNQVELKHNLNHEDLLPTLCKVKTIMMASRRLFSKE